MDIDETRWMMEHNEKDRMECLSITFTANVLMLACTLGFGLLVLAIMYGW